MWLAEVNVFLYYNFIENNVDKYCVEKIKAIKKEISEANKGNDLLDQLIDDL
jgi:predicted ATPase